MKRFILFCLPLALVLSGAFAPVRAQDVSKRAVEESLTCQCGCGLTVANCNHLNCSFGVPLKEEVSVLVDQGLERDEILVRFREKYGEKILSSPVAEGFNLVAWILPFAVLVGGVALVVGFVRRWSRVEEEGEGEAAPSSGGISDDERKRLESELDRDR